jgi:hypothetical protein
MMRINGDQRVQSEVLEGLATAVNHRRWFVELAIPFAMSPVDIATGHVRRYTKKSMRWAREASG